MLNVECDSLPVDDVSRGGGVAEVPADHLLPGQSSAPHGDIRHGAVHRRSLPVAAVVHEDDVVVQPAEGVHVVVVPVHGIAVDVDLNVIGWEYLTGICC